MNIYTKTASRKGSKSFLAAALVIMVVAALTLPAAAFAATSATDSSSTKSTTTSTQVAAGTSTNPDTSSSGNQPGQGQAPPMNEDGTMPELPEGFDASNMPSDMQGGPTGGGGMNPFLLGGGIGLIALALGFAGGFAVGRMTGKKAAKKTLTAAPATKE